MSLSTVTGLLMAIVILVLAVMSGTSHYMLFASVSSLLIVLGGTITAALISYSYPIVFQGIKAIFMSLFDGRDQIKLKHEAIKRSIEWNTIFRNDGITGLENSLTAKEQNDPFISMAVQLLGSGYKGKELENLLHESNESQTDLETIPTDVLNTMASFSPAFGMIGTLVGLIIMLDNLDGDMDAMGKGLAIALLTTLYGTLFAQMLFKPSAINVKRKVDENHLKREMQIRAFVLMTEKHPDLFIQDSMNAFLPAKKRLD